VELFTKIIKRYLLPTTLVFALAACGGSDDTPDTVVDVAVDAGNFTTLIAALQATGLDQTLSARDGSFTVFAPTDEAFAELGQDTIDALLADTDTLTDILLYHVISGAEVAAVDAMTLTGQTQEMANGDDLAISMCGTALCVNLSDVTSEDLQADNGIVHVINKVMLPPAEMGMPTLNIPETAIAAGNFTTLVTALQAADLVGTLADPDSTFTVFAPTDDAFALIPQATLDGLLADVPALTNVLLQHVVSGTVDSVTAFSLNGTNVDTVGGEDVTLEIVNGVLEVQGAGISTYDIYTTNGVIHVIDAVITETLQ